MRHTINRVRFSGLFFSFLFLLGSFSALSADDPAEHFRMIRMDGSDGLLSSSVSGIVQDAYGFLWFATQGGLSRFDGNEFTHYTKEPFNRESLPHDLVQTIYSDGGYTIWAGTYNGMARIDLRTGALKRYLPSGQGKDGLNGAVVTSINRDVRGSLWVGTLNGLNRLDDEEEEIYTSFLEDITVRSVFSAADGTLWIGTYNGLYRFIHGEERFIHYPAEAGNPDALQTPFVMSLTEDAEGTLWIGTWGNGGLASFDDESEGFTTFALPAEETYVLDCEEDGRIWIGSWGGGLMRFNPGDGSVVRYRQEDGKSGGLGTDIVYSLFRDNAGLFWVGTNGGGVTRMIPIDSEFPFWGHDEDDAGTLPPGKITTVYEDRAGSLWVGVYGAGLNRYIPEEDRWVNYRHNAARPDSLSNDIVNTVYESRDGTFWVCTNSGLNIMDRGAGAFSLIRADLDGIGEPGEDIVYDILEDGEGEYWIATYRGGIVFMDSASGDMRFYRHDKNDPSSISDNMVYTLLLDENRTLWAGTNRGLNRYLPESDSFVSYTHKPEETGSISADTIRTLLIDGSKRFWVGTVGGGLNLMDREQGLFRFWSRQDGFPDNTIVSLLEDDKGALWVGTGQGLGIFDPKRSSFKLLDETDGIIGEEFNVGAFRNSRGELYFGSLAGVVKITPSTFSDNTHIPPVQLTSFRIFDKEYEDGKLLAEVESVVLSHRQNFISFEFTALDYTDPEKNEYMYRLSGFDRDWIYAGNRRYASYTNLPGGDYIFEVRGSNNDGIWNEEGRRMAITVVPPLWVRPAAFIIYILLLAGIVVLAVFLFVKRARKALSLEERRLERQRMQLLEREVVKREEVERQLRLAKESAEHIAQAKSHFIAKLSHELRTPLNAIIGYSRFIIRESEKPELREYAGIISASGQQLNQFVDEVLDLSRSEAGKEVLSPVSVHLRSLVRDAIRIVEPAGLEKGIDIISKVDENVPEYANIDEGKFRQVLYNLMSNAVKFTSEGLVTLSLSKDDGMLVWKVSDTGMGIPEDQRERIFEAFEQQLDQDRFYGGSGLGLTICRNNVLAMGGSLMVAERMGGGSVFTVSLPFERGDGSPSGIIPGQIPDSVRERPLVLGAGKYESLGRQIDSLEEELKLRIGDILRKDFERELSSVSPSGEGFWMLEGWEEIGRRMESIGLQEESRAVSVLGEAIRSAAAKARLADLKHLFVIVSLFLDGQDLLFVNN
jgi:signal transduction histidine kinase/ligand-binding sensor domain-containing protein